MIEGYLFVFYASAKGWSSISAVNKINVLLIFSLKLIKYARDL